MKFKTVQEYYSYQSQCNCFAPDFNYLIESVKQKWIKDFNEYCLTQKS